ncbi:MAG: hypothetical protein V3V08_17175 [Nannocystaceae bacterium]
MATKRRSRAEWQRITQGYRSSGLTQEASCKRAGVSLSALQNWLYRKDGDEARFVPMTTSSSPTGSDAMQVRVGEVLVTLPSSATVDNVAELVVRLEQRRTGA